MREFYIFSTQDFYCVVVLLPMLQEILFRLLEKIKFFSVYVCWKLLCVDHVINTTGIPMQRQDADDLGGWRVS